MTRSEREKKVSESDEDREEDLIEKTIQGPLQEKNHKKYLKISVILTYANALKTIEILELDTRFSQFKRHRRKPTGKKSGKPEN